MSLQEEFNKAEALYSAAMMYQTWGHLEPKRQVKYYGYIIFTESETGDLVVIKSQLGDLGGSPGLFEEMQDYIWNYTKDKDCSGKIYRFYGYYIRFKNGNCRFVGKVTEVPYSQGMTFEVKGSQK